MLLLLYSLGHGTPAFYMVDVDEPLPALPQAHEYEMDYSDSYLAEKKSIVSTPKKGSSVRPEKAGNPNRKKDRSSKLAKRREDWKKAEQEALKQLEDLNNVQYEKDNYLTEPAEAALAGGNTEGDDYFSGVENYGNCISIDENTCIYES